MKNIRFFQLLSLALILCLMLSRYSQGQEAGSVPAPDSFFGFKPGDDRMLLDYEQLISYLQEVDKASPRVKMVEIGKSPEGKPIYIAFISTEKNIENLEELKRINRELALNPLITETDLEMLIKNGKVFFLATLSMHSTEVAPSQSAPLIAYKMATARDTELLEWMEDVVYMMVPCHNPDGMDMVVEHYRKYKGTKYEGSSLPGVYHKYIGHDNNRDFVKLSQDDTKAIASIYNLEWFPQVMVEKHQMGSRGVRYFVPPPHDPIAENVDAGIWNWIGVFGSNMMTDMTKDGLSGIAQHYLFDDYWPGSTETCIWKNVIGFLTEAASVNLATPIYIEDNELGAYGKGLAEYKKSINMPDPWPGGWWKLSDIIDYELSSTFSIIKTSSLYREQILRFRNDICRKEVDKGKNEAPYYYILPQEQRDRGELCYLVALLQEHGVRIFELAEDYSAGEWNFRKGDVIIPLAQPFRAFIKEMMEAQEFPLRHYTPDGEIIRPYDITSWSLPLHNGVKSYEINIKTEINPILKPIDRELLLEKDEIPSDSRMLIFSANNNDSFKAAFLAGKSGMKVERLDQPLKFKGEVYPAGSFVIHPQDEKSIQSLCENLITSPAAVSGEISFESTPVTFPRIALVEHFMHDMDAGWTRFLFDGYGIDYKVIRPGDFEKTDFSKLFDVVVFPNSRKSILMEGKYKSGSEYYISSYPPEFTKGIGKKGLEKLMGFVDNGGIIVSWGQSSELFTGTLSIKRGEEEEEFRLPFSDISDDASKKDFYCPGSFVKIKVRGDHPLTYGLPQETGVFYRGTPLFSTSIPNFDMDRRVLAKFPEKDILLSGYIENEKAVADKSVALWLKKGRGQFVLFAFNPQFRASTAATYKFLFNALFLPKTE